MNSDSMYATFFFFSAQAPIYVAEITPKTVRGALMSVKPVCI